MSDDVKAAVDAVRHSIENYHRHGLNSLSLPTLQSLLAHIDGEAGRTAEAVTRARAEMREACERHYRNLFDAAAALRERAEKAEAERDELRRRMEVVLHAGPSTALAASVFDRARRAEVERDEALRAVTQVTAERDFAQSVAKMNHERLMEVVRALRLLDANKGCDCCSGDRFAEACELTSAVLAKHPEGA
jgi:hypothetical protein